MGPFTYANLANAAFIETLFQEYLKNPEAVDITWRRFFDGIQFNTAGTGGTAREMLEGADLRLYFLIEAYRRFGHLKAEFNPLFKRETPQLEELNAKQFGLKDTEMDTLFPTYGFLPAKSAPLTQIIQAVQKTYAGQIGFEYMHIANPHIRSFIAEKIEPTFTSPFSPEEEREILHALNRSEIFESFIHKKYPGQKRFSLEGAETLIPMLIQMIRRGKSCGVKEVSMAMAHRGRLNVLANVLGKSYKAVFTEFEGGYLPETPEGGGDVKYHKGFVSTVEELAVRVECNPSHLESVNPVQLGRVRARGECRYAGNFSAILPMAIHGDASITAQGVVYETLQMSHIDGYNVGGAVHIVINNQVGFTAEEEETRSTTYCTDIAHSFECPVFHVNAEDPDSCIYASRLAVELRQKFGCDVFIDLVSYRKYGHNETDEPTFTQPEMVGKITSRQSIRNLYRGALIAKGSITDAACDALAAECLARLHAAEQEKNLLPPPNPQEFIPIPQQWQKGTVTSEELIAWIKGIFTLPETFNLHPKLHRLFMDRIKAAETGEKKLDWGCTELLAYASLLSKKIPVRLSGEDSQRGTFSHRHATLVDQTTFEHYTPLQHLFNTSFSVYNSPLSEFGVLGFEFGYSLDAHGLTIWEAQYGDFANGAQVIIDQYIAASEKKWGVTSNLTLYLPHGYEGQGPEHSSGRIERFLQLAGQENMLISVPSTAAQFFHLIRRQAFASTKKPLIVFTPKALLRFAPSLASIADLADGTFQLTLADGPKDAEVVILCTGKVYFDLVEDREKRKRQDVTLVRIEELYPLPKAEISALFDTYTHAKKWLWVQEEPRNMGAWNYIQEELSQKKNLCYVGRKRSASTAVGSLALHTKEKEAFLNEAFS